MRLIDADKLIKQFHYGGIADTEEDKAWTATVRRTIKAQPTAYNIDEKVKQLEGLKDTEQDDSVAEFISTRIWNKAISKAIEIVKGGAE